MSAGAEALARSEVHPRARRFAALRAAQRALAFALEGSPELPSNREARAVLALVQPLTKRVDKGLSVPKPRPLPELLEVDAALDAFAEKLRHAVGAAPVDRLREWLRDPDDERREQARALLDLCLEDESHSSACVDVVDLLVTRLVTVAYGGFWSVAQDPVDLTPLMRERCMHAELRGREVEAELTRRLRLACDRIYKGDSVPEVAAEIRELKQQLGDFFFIPEVLRCIAYANVALRNSHEAARAGEAGRAGGA